MDPPRLQTAVDGDVREREPLRAVAATEADPELPAHHAAAAVAAKRRTGR